MNQGGEPEHDDYGLPPVDIKVPDDARELYRDVQAYYRELRAMRRHERSRRWRAPLRRTGLVLPLIAGCLAAAMIASMVLTMFSANPYFSGMAGQNAGKSGAGQGRSGTASGSATPSGSASGAASPAPSATGRAASQIAGVPLPGATIVAAGKPVLLSQLNSAALAIVPASCGCAAAIGELVRQARLAGVTLYLVASGASLSELSRLMPGGSAGTAIVATDAANVLQATYKPTGLTILLVDSRGTVTVRSGFRAGISLEKQLRALKPAA